MTTILSGFDGKLPSRGDFVGDGLPRSFLAPWQAWVEACLTASRSVLRDTWLDAWMQAPIWRFALPGGACGPDAVLGLTMPSVDKVGRHYPLTAAAVFPGRSRPAACHDWLDAAERLLLDALTSDWLPAALAEGLRGVPAPAPEPCAAGWWTAGGPLVPATRLPLLSLPRPMAFAPMIAGGDATRETS